MKDPVGKCSVCHEVYTSNHVQIDREIVVYVCGCCVEKAKINFIWLCMSCGKTFVNPKKLVIARIKDHELKRAYMLCEDKQIIQGIDKCISCHPERLVEYMELQAAGADC